MNRFFVDAESDGLYGGILSVAALVTNEENRELEHFYGAVDPARCRVTVPWVRENVVTYLAEAEAFYDSETALLTAFWAFWSRHREQAECIADVGYPVEAGLFTRCVALDPKTRYYQGPYPLLDLATLLRARGIDPLRERASLCQVPLTAHNAMNDVRMTAELWHRYI